MAKRPFNIFPSIGYRNSQFQILSTIDNLKIELHHQGKLAKTIIASSENPTLILRLDSSGIYTAKCLFQNQSFEQEIEVKDAFRLGSSEFKKAFVFDNSDHSFILMKDRLLLYDETKNLLFTENHYSPTEIRQIDKNNYLFITRIGNQSNGIINLGIYSTDSLSLIDALLNEFQEICLSPETNKVWLFKKSTESIHCFGLINHSGNAFSEIRKFENASKYSYDSKKGRIFIEQEDKIILLDTEDLLKSFELLKTPNVAIDKNGSQLIITDGKQIQCINEFQEDYKKVVYSENLNLDPSDYIFVGTNLKTSNHFIDLSAISSEIKDKVITSLPDNKTSYYVSLPDNEKIKESMVQHSIYPTRNGLFILRKDTEREFSGVTLQKIQGIWTATPYTIPTNTYTLSFHQEGKTEIKVGPTNSFSIKEYHSFCLIIKSDNRTCLFNGTEEIEFENESSFTFLSVNKTSYILVKDKDLHSLYSTSNLQRPILKQVQIHNLDFIDSHKIVWYSGTENVLSKTNFLNAFDLSSGFHLLLDVKRAQHSLFKDASEYKISRSYILSSNQIVINPENSEIKDSFIGTIESHSKKLNKIVSHRTNYIYLSIYNPKIKKYEEFEIKLDDSKYKESYLSPNGQFLVLQDDSNKYLWYDIGKNETVKFLSGNFLAFSKEGNLLIEEDGTRAVKIFDPLTFADITPPNYHHYTFLSPDGKLYAQLGSKTRYFNKLNGVELSASEVSKLRQDLDSPSGFHSTDPAMKHEYDKATERVDRNRRQYFLTNKDKFVKLNIGDHSQITSQTVVKVEQFTQIGIVGTDVTVEVLFPEDLVYYNYSAFSYDNKYFGYVGKPFSNGLIHLFKLEYDERNNKLAIVDSYLSGFPRYASWVCGFAKTGYFATYDSTPDTYLVKVSEQLFESKTNELDLWKNIYNRKDNIYHSYNMWNVIKGKNFLCFSPTGEYLTLSEQGYEPLTLGGYGHQESNAVHIAKTETGQIIDSFTGHGDKIKDDKTKKVTFVAFSEDEKRIMTLSSDGVVVIRETKVKEPIENKQEEEMPAGNIV